jgi:hypothetical protein
VFRRTLLALALLAAIEAPAPAAPSQRPLTTEPGNFGAVMAHRYSGALGASGLVVATTPTMMLLTGVTAGSPAALLDLPSLERSRVRLAAVDGVAVEDLPLAALLSAFEHSPSVRLTLARKGADDLVEDLIGPFELLLSKRAIARKADVALECTLLDARDAAAAGDFEHASEVAAAIPTNNSLRRTAQQVQAGAFEARQREILERADLLASQGNFPAALRMLESIISAGAWGELRRLRERDWQRAVLMRQERALARTLATPTPQPQVDTGAQQRARARARRAAQLRRQQEQEARQRRRRRR